MQVNNWFRRNLKWLIPVAGIMIIAVYLFSSSGMGKITTNLAQAYADKSLYKNAIEKANSHQEVLGLLGKIAPPGKMTILNGEVNYSDENKKVRSTIKIEGEKRNGKMDIVANKENGGWSYEKIDIRLEDPENNKQTIEVIIR